MKNTNSNLQLQLGLAYPRIMLYGALFIFIGIYSFSMGYSESNGDIAQISKMQFLFSILFISIGLIPLLSFRIIIISASEKTISIGVNYFLIFKKMDTYQFTDFERVRVGAFNRTYSTPNTPTPIGVLHSTQIKETDILFINEKGKVVFDIKNINNKKKIKLIVDTIKEIKTSLDNK